MSDKQWVCVTEALPKRDEDVLVFSDGTIERASRRWNGEVFIWCKWNRDCGLEYEVTHWMPLPKLPEPRIKDE